jgi:hypothetical protein
VIYEWEGEQACVGLLLPFDQFGNTTTTSTMLFLLLISYA